MPSKDSVESLLQMLVNTPETEKGSVIYSLVKALREACGLFRKSSNEYQEAAKRVQEILDNVSSETIQEEEWEDEFSNSSSEDKEKIHIDKSYTSDKIAVSEDFFEEEIEEVTSSQTFTPPPIPIGNNRTSSKTVIIKPENRIPPKVSSEEPVVEQTPINKLLSTWNSSVGNWLKLPATNISQASSVVKLVQGMSALRSNILSNTFEDQNNTLSKLDRLWEDVAKMLQENNFRLTPNNFSTTSIPQGRTIYACRSRIASIENELICPGIWQGDNLLKDSIWVVSYPSEGECPSTASRVSMQNHWRGVFGEVEALIEQIKIQIHGLSAIESVNKNKVEALDDSRETLIEELNRRVEVLESTIQKDIDNIYRVATDYWRVEEFFWSLYHEDDRPVGCSVFDRLRNRLQSWRPVLRRILKFQVRDFNYGTDSLASVNKYIGNIIISNKQGTAPGMVIRELRPAVMVTVQGSNRLLKGRVIAT